MTLLYRSATYLDHDTGPHHPERPDRLRAIERRLDDVGLLARCDLPTWNPISDEALARVHPHAYSAGIALLAEAGGGLLDPDTVVSSESDRAARLAAGAAVDAVDRVLRGESRRALSLHRPPGHHASETLPMGFCLYNHAALAARHALAAHGLERVLIVDWDVHHGNGTQDVFYEDPQVGFLSIHRFPFWPGTGSREETGAGAGLGTTLNLPQPYDIHRSKFIQRFTLGLETFAEKLRPQLVILSAGFDAHRLDPIGDLGLEAEDFATLTRRVAEVAEVHAGGRIVSLLEGGYHLHALAEGVELHLRALADDLPSDC